jgi:hypothetical protein
VAKVNFLSNLPFLSNPALHRCRQKTLAGAMAPPLGGLIILEMHKLAHPNTFFIFSSSHLG